MEEKKRADARGFLFDNGTGLAMEHYSKVSVMRHTHVHPRYELYFCTEKVLQKSVINGVEQVYRYPCVILSTPYTVHSMSCEEAGATSYDRYVFYFDEGLVSAFGAQLLPKALFSRNTGLLFALTEGQAAYLKRLIDHCEPSATLVQRELMFLLFVHKLLAFCPMEQVVQIGTPSVYIQDVMQYVSEHLEENWDGEVLAKRFAVSRSKLDRDFKGFTGMTLHRFCELCRLNRAKYLLERRPELSAVQIATACGFESETYFFPFFKAKTGMTPMEFRQQIGQRTPDDSMTSDRGCGEI